ncbi:MAG TPA: GntR family transcriptional regulator [Armatimonadaceae bacterium]|nr:GntR family transcriptional regulator [Armatimonadaceae bacterium]
MRVGAESEPLYLQIYRDLEHKISTGQIRYMEQLPILPDLCRIYGVSEAPVRRALDELARDGLVVKQRGRGKGTFAIKRLTKTTVRVLLAGEYDLSQTPIEFSHEVFDFLGGIRDAGKDQGCLVQQVSAQGFEALPPAGSDTGYLIIAITAEGFTEGIALAERHNAPYVLVNPPARRTPCVRVDMEQGAFLGVNYLAQLGHRRIAYVGGSAPEWHGPRRLGYERALSQNGLEADPDLIRGTDGVDTRQDAAALDALLALPQPPTAIFAGSDYRALHLLSACRERGISVPGQLSLCGYDGIDAVANVTPALTTVHHPRYELGTASVGLLVDIVTGMRPRNDGDALDVTVPPQLVVRDSCAAPGR